MEKPNLEEMDIFNRVNVGHYLTVAKLLGSVAALVSYGIGVDNDQLTTNMRVLADNLNLGSLEEEPGFRLLSDGNGEIIAISPDLEEFDDVYDYLSIMLSDRTEGLAGNRFMGIVRRVVSSGIFDSEAENEIREILPNYEEGITE